MDKIYTEATEGLIDFIGHSPSCYHVVRNICSELKENGFSELAEADEWNIEKGGKYFVVRNMSSVIAFRVPENDAESFMITASHSDSPSFKIKPNAEMETEGCYIKLNAEKYGGMICSTWLDRPLSIAGRVVVDTENGIETRLADVGRDICLIPNLAIHMNREVNDGYKFNAQKDMIPLLGDDTAKGGFLGIVADCVDADEKDILGYDLFVYNRQKGTIWGLNKEYFSTGKIDDLQCAYSSMKAIELASNDRSIDVMLVADNEEVGSGTKQGALSTFLFDTLTRICAALGKTPNDYRRLLASSMMLSADNGHAVHPNIPEKADPTNKPKLNGGIVIKYNASQKYTTDAVSEAMLKKILIAADIPYQEYVNRSDILGGSTLGNLSNQQVSLNTVDIGLAQLAMHSAYETGGTKDTAYMTAAMTAFFNTNIKYESAGAYTVTRVGRSS